MKIIATILLSCFILTLVSGQNNELKYSNKLLSGTNYYFNNERITKSQVEETLSEDLIALSYFENANKNFAISRVISSIGGLIIAWEVGKLLTGKQVNEKRPLLAVGIIVIAIPIHSSGRKKMNKVVDFYSNGQTGTVPIKAKSEIALIGNSRGLGLGLLF